MDSDDLSGLPVLGGCADGISCSRSGQKDLERQGQEDADSECGQADVGNGDARDLEIGPGVRRGDRTVIPCKDQEDDIDND